MKKKLIEVALPLEAINKASAREKSIRHGHPSTLHLWWARRPLATARAILFGQLVDDPNQEGANPELVLECRNLPKGQQTLLEDTPRNRLFDFIEKLVQWENTTNAEILEQAHRLILLSTDGNPPPVLDPFSGGATIPLEAQRLGLRAYGSDLNPVAVMIGKASIEIPPRFANKPPVRPEPEGKKFSSASYSGAQGLAEDVRFYGAWMKREAEKKIGHLYPKVDLNTGLPVLEADVLADREDPPAFVRLAHKNIPPTIAGGNLKTLENEQSTPLQSRSAQLSEGRVVQSEAERGGVLSRSSDGATVIAWLWARTVASPNPAANGVHVPLVRSFELSTKPGKESWVEPVVDAEHSSYRFVVRSGKRPADALEGTVGRTGATCILTGSSFPLTYIRAEGKAGRMGERLMAVVAEGNRARVYLSPTQEMEDLARAVVADWQPDAELPHNPRDFKTPNYGMTTFGDLFTARQLVALTTFSDLVLEARAQAYAHALTAGLSADETPLEDGGSGARAYADAVSVYLGFGASRLADAQSSLCRWSPGADQTVGTFARQALPMVWDFAESNAFANAAGDFSTFLKSILKVIANFTPGIQGFEIQSDARSSFQIEKPIISTDPPYYDNIGYADLSDYFYVWMRRSLRLVYPKLFGSMLVPKEAELVATPYRHGGKDNAERFFMEGMTKAIENMAQSAHPDYPTAIYYAFKQEEAASDGLSSTGWATFLEAVLSAGFSINGTWPVRSEREGRTISLGSNALASSIVLVCRCRAASAPLATRAEFLRALRLELPAALKELQKAGIAPVDMAQASIGPGMATFSRYAEVLEADGSRLDVRGALAEINRALDDYYGEQEVALDSRSRFIVSWFETFGFESGEYGRAETLATGRGVSVQSVADTGVLSARAGKVKLLRRSELPEVWKSENITVWEATQRLISALEGGEDLAAGVTGRLGEELAGAARDLAYRLYTVCERKGWAQEAAAYNLLVLGFGSVLQRKAHLEGEAEQVPLFS